ncbi:hypothetical protein K438DRAFT_1997011 [Mycena galopus ATCC 62051]|nr:hypothetical protein K438DRAFT_1997011 [Mycena galopus ATCC 62051]
MSRVPDFANRGKCLNSVCGSGCTFFILDPGPLPTHPGLVKCVICTLSGCCAAQHADLDMPVPAPASAPQAAPPTSATFNTMQGSRPSAGPAKPNPFRAHAQKRQADVETKFADLGKTAGENTIPKKFHPAHNAQLAADLNPLDSKKRKRPNQTPQSGSSVPKRKDWKDYTVVMVEDTKAVTAHKYEKPNANKLGALNAKGYVQVVSLHGQNTGEEITGAVSTVFMATVPDVDTYGFRILEVHAVNLPTQSGRTSKKSSFLLKPISLALDIAVWKRDAGPGYKNIIFVALSSEAPNLPLPGVTNPKPARSTDGGSDGEESSGEKPHNENDSENITQPKDSATKSPAESDGETACNTSNDGPPRKKERPVTPDFGQEYPEFSMNEQDETAFDFEDTV